MDTNETVVTPDEAKAEEEALTEAKEDEVRAKVIADLGLSEDDNSELIDKVVEREIANRKKLSEAIGQKIKYRDAATKSKPAQQEKKDTQSFDPEAIRKQAETAALATLEQRDLEEMEYPDEIKAEIKRVAQVQGVSVRKAEKDPYIQHRIAEAVADNRVNEAAVTRTPKSTKAATDAKPDFDMSTEEGRKAFDEWKKSKKE